MSKIYIDALNGKTKRHGVCIISLKSTQNVNSLHLVLYFYL